MRERERRRRRNKEARTTGREQEKEGLRFFNAIFFNKYL
jgi:hypothetical protein